jgi:glycosyltransferase involved in cell wall biosynthesis
MAEHLQPTGSEGLPAGRRAIWCGSVTTTEAGLPEPPPKPAMDVSIVIPCRNAEAHFRTQLEAISSQVYDGPWELVISDNGSTDHSLSIAEEYRCRVPRLVVVDSSAVVGPSGARNAGVRAASSDRILFCDADDQVAAGWLSAMASALEQHAFVAANVDQQRLNPPVPLRELPSRPGLLESRPPWLPYMFGGALGIRRSLHEFVGGFDEKYRDSGEDRDYCYRVQLAGAPLVFVPEAVVYYRHRTGVLESYRQSRSYARGHVQLYREYRALGLRRPSVSRALVSWALTPPRLVPALTSRQRFTLWVSRLGWRIGRVEASIRYRVWAL